MIRLQTPHSAGYDMRTLDMKGFSARNQAKHARAAL